jgi:hypothetical protein
MGNTQVKRQQLFQNEIPFSNWRIFSMPGDNRWRFPPHCLSRCLRPTLGVLRNIRESKRWGCRFAMQLGSFGEGRALNHDVIDRIYSRETAAIATHSGRRWSSLLVGILPIVLIIPCSSPAKGQQGNTDSLITRSVQGISQPGEQRTIEALVDRLAAAEARIKELEQRMNGSEAAEVRTPETPGAPLLPEASAPADAVAVGSTNTPPARDADDSHAHMMGIPGGPKLQIRGFFDFNYGMGPAANPLQFPLGAQAHNTFQAGEFDLFISSKLSEHLSFVGEMVYGWGQTNELGVDIERYQLTYKQNEYFQISAGRYHSAIGYYNTAYHHGTWFGTATGRPFMYYYEDSGGLLPVHQVGITASGLIPGTGHLGLHWVAEGGNGRSSNNDIQPVQNFLSDRNHKAFNLAFYSRPDWAPGLQVGGSWYHDRLVPAGIPHVTQDIESAYVVYLTPRLEFMNEAVLLTNRLDGTGKPFHTPLMYTQIAKRFGKYTPYFRYQYVNSPGGDPVNVYTDRYQGPSLGLRFDFAEFASFKLQYNRLDQRAAASNSLDSQIGFTF